MYEQERAVVVGAVRQAAALTEQVRAEGGADRHAKADQSPVTLADFSAQALIARALSAAFPADPIVGEESAEALRADPALCEAVRARVAAQVGEVDAAQVCAWIDRGASREPAARFWTVDPIDGTKGYLRGQAYAVAAALVVDGRPVASALACPWLPGGAPGAVFWATRGGGAFEEPLAGGEPRRLRVAARPPGELRRVESFEPGHADRKTAARVAAGLGTDAEPLRIDSMAKYALVARGDADLYLRVPKSGYQENVWDHAAGALLVEEAGGRVTTRAGAPLRFDQGARFDTGGAIAASSGACHDQVLALLS